MPTYSELNQRHPSWNEDRQRDLEALYEGGDKFKERIQRFLPQRPAEPSQRYTLRKAEAVYRNYLGPIIDYFAALLFTTRPVATAKDEAGKPKLDLDEFYGSFRDDCDGNGADIDAFFKDRLTQAMVGGRSWFLLNQRPHGSVDLNKISRADFDAAKLGDTWLSAVRSCDVLDWEEDETGGLEWAIIHGTSAKRAGPGAGRNFITETWLFLTPESVETFAVTYPKDKPPQAEDQVPSRGAQPHRFGRVPLVKVQPKIALWVANRLETPQLAHFRLSNAQTWGMSATCYAMPVFHVQNDQDGKPRMPTMGAGYGLVLGVDESLDWATPPADIYAALGTEIKSHKDEIFRIAHQMALGVENNAAAVGRSAESKMNDAEATRVVMLAYAALAKETIEYVYDMISAARGDTYEWSIGGLDGFKSVDIAGLVESLAKLQEAGGIPSKKFHTEIKSRLSDAYLPDIDESLRAEIKAEIAANTTDQIPNMHLVELAQMHDIANRIADGGVNADAGGTGAGGGEKPQKAPTGGAARGPAATKPS